MSFNFSTLKWKGSCRYGEDCFRVNPVHLKEYRHVHLETIVTAGKSNGQYEIPDSLFVTKDIIMKQLDVLKAMMPVVAASPVRKTTAHDSSTSPSNSAKRQRLNNSPDMVVNVSTPLVKRTTSPVLKLRLPNANIPKLVDKPRLKQPEVVASPAKPAQEHVQESSPNPTNSTFPAPSTSTTQQSRPPRNFPKIEEVFKVIAPKGRMAEKLQKAAPYNFFLTTITDSKPTHFEPLSVTFQELLDPSLGVLESSLQINFMVDIGFLMAHYIFSGNENKPMVILQGQDTDDLRRISTRYPEISSIKIQMNGAFGTHHTKMMLFVYQDNSVRVVVSTANLVEDDWHNRTQGIWISPACPALPEGSDTSSGDSPTGFKDSLLRYLIEYKIPKLQHFIVKVRKCDFSHINVFFVASSPGGHRSTPKGPLWGHPRLGYILEKNAPKIDDICPVVVQCSSIGSLGANANSWVLDEFVNSLRKDTTPNGLRRRPEFKMIYPSFNNVVNGHDGILSGGCLPYSKKVNDKQLWLKNYLYQWKSKTCHRNNAMPHIKTYCRWTDDQLAWFCLTSANLSKAAWGAYNKTGNFERPLRINNWEAGVLFLPKFVTGKDYFSRKEFPMPYDVPLVKYGIDDVPFVSDLLF